MLWDIALQHTRSARRARAGYNRPVRDPYDVLGVTRSASADEIKGAYRKLSKEWHPDKHKGDKAAEDRFKEINQAYEILGDAEKKKKFDTFGSAGGPGGQGFSGFDFSRFDFGGNGAPDLEDLFGSFFGGAGRKQRAQERGEDLEMRAEVTLGEVLTGVERTVRLRRMMPCGTCRGSGSAEGGELLTCDECGGTGTVVKRNSSFFGVIEQRALCTRCGGSGKVPKHPCGECSGEGRRMHDDTLAFRIPPGVHDGQTLRVTGGGGAGRRGTPPGDLFVHIAVSPDARFVRDGDDIRSTLTIDVAQAALGDEVDVETLHGTVRLKIPEGTQPGQTLRIKGKGLPSLSSGKTGNHDVGIVVEVPRKLSRAQRKLLEEWRGLR